MDGRFPLEVVADDASSLPRRTLSTSSGRGGDALEHGGQALTAADAHGLQAVARAAAAHLAQQRGEDPPAGGADRMAERDARAVAR